MEFLRNVLCTMLIFQLIIQISLIANFTLNASVFCHYPLLFFSFPLLYFPFLTTHTHTQVVSCIAFFFSDVTHLPFPDECSQTALIFSCSLSSETTLEANVFKCYPHYILYKLQIQCWQASNPAHFSKLQGQ